MFNMSLFGFRTFKLKLQKSRDIFRYCIRPHCRKTWVWVRKRSLQRMMKESPVGYRRWLDPCRVVIPDIGLMLDIFFLSLHGILGIPHQASIRLSPKNFCFERSCHCSTVMPPLTTAPKRCIIKYLLRSTWNQNGNSGSECILFSVGLYSWPVIA